MKYIAILFLLLGSPLLYAQSARIDMVETFLINDSNQSLWQIEEKEKEIQTGLSELMQERVLRKGKAFRANALAIKNLAHTEMKSTKPSMNLSMRLFDDKAASLITIDKINVAHGRTIMRGSLAGVPGSKVRLIEYNGALSGTMSYPKTETVVVLLSDGADVSAAYEVDIAGLEFD